MRRHLVELSVHRVCNVAVSGHPLEEVSVQHLVVNVPVNETETRSESLTRNLRLASYLQVGL